MHYAIIILYNISARCGWTEKYINTQIILFVFRGNACFRCIKRGVSGFCQHRGLCVIFYRKQLREVGIVQLFLYAG